MNTNLLASKWIAALLIGVALVLSACKLTQSINQSPIDEPTEEIAPEVLYQESRVRGILLDIQKYPMEEIYRTQFSKDINVIEALRRWDAGVRVTNADEFEKVILDRRSVFVRSSAPTMEIDEMEIMLTTD